jgi:hypothetical protein
VDGVEVDLAQYAEPDQVPAGITVEPTSESERPDDAPVPEDAGEEGTTPA